MVKTKAIRPSMMTVSVRVVPCAMTIPGTSLAGTHSPKARSDKTKNKVHALNYRLLLSKNYATIAITALNKTQARYSPIPMTAGRSLIREFVMREQ